MDRRSLGPWRCGRLARALAAIVAVAIGGAGPDRAAAAAVTISGGLMPYQVQKKTLDNGLDVLVVPMPEFKDVLSFNTLVLAGARNETVKGQTGLAHLFEHILFRHRFGGQANGYDEAMDRMGAHNNAWTSFDVTYYHPLTFKSNLTGRDQRPGLLELESARFIGLDFDEKIFKTETGAVLGEYRRGASNPAQRMDEKMLELLFGKHPYGHTTIGYYDDVVAMPNHYEAARHFYETYYRPNNCIVVVAGDVVPDEIFAKVAQSFSAWKRQEVPPIEAEAPPQGGGRTHVDWESDVAPRVSIAYRLPAHRSASKETAVGQLVPELLFSESAPLYQSLRYRKKSASEIDFGGKRSYESFDSRMFEVTATLFKDQYEAKGKAYLEEMIGDLSSGIESLRSFSTREDSSARLEVLKKKYKYDFLSGMRSPADVAQLLAWYYRFERDAAVLDALLATVDTVTPRDVDEFAQKFFVEGNRHVVTLTAVAAEAAAPSKAGSR